MNINQPLKSVLSWLTVLLCMLTIYLLSAQPAKISDGNSMGAVTHAVDTTVKLTKAKIIESEKLKLVDRINSVAREYMHGVMFLVLGILVQNAVTISAPREIKMIAISLTVCLIYSITDEIHQLFVPGRAFQLSDLVMDTIGSMIGIAAMWFLYNRVRRKG